MHYLRSLHCPLAPPPAPSVFPTMDCDTVFYRGQYSALKTASIFFHKAEIIDMWRKVEVLVGHLGPIKHYIMYLENFNEDISRH